MTHRVQGKQRTLADVRRANGTEATEKMIKKIAKERLAADREAISQALSNPTEKSVTENLLDLKQKIDRSGTAKQRKEFARIFQGELKSDKEMLDWALSESKNSGDLLSIEKEVKAFGSKAQKEQWAKLYEQYNPIKQKSNYLTDKAVSEVTQFQGNLDPIKPANTQAHHNKMQQVYEDLFGSGEQVRTPQSDAAVAKVTQFKGDLVPQIKPANTDTYHNKMQQVYDDLFGAVKEGGQTTKPQQSLQDIMDDLTNRRNSWMNSDPAKDLARQVSKPSIPENLIPPVAPKELTPGEIYRIGLEEGVKKAKKAVNHNTTNNNFYNTFITEINDNVSTNIQKELGKFEKTQQTFLAGIDTKLTQFGENQAQTLGRFENLATRMDGTLTQMEGAAQNIGRSATRIGNAANTIEGAATTIGNAANTIEGAATSIGQSATKIGDAAAKMDGLTGRLEQALEAGQKAQSTLKNLKWAAIGAGVVLGAIALFKACTSDSKKAAVTPEPDKAQGNEVVTIIDKGNKKGKPVVPTKPEVEEKPREYWFNRDAIKGVPAPKLDEVPQIELPDLGKFFPEEIANGDDIVNGNLDGKKVYVAKKGDCIWRIAKKILAKSPELKKSIKEQLKNKSDDAIIQVVTMQICKANNINYYADPQKLPKIGAEVTVPEKFLEEIKEALKDKTLNEALAPAA